MTGHCVLLPMFKQKGDLSECGCQKVYYGAIKLLEQTLKVTECVFERSITKNVVADDVQFVFRTEERNETTDAIFVM